MRLASTVLSAEQSTICSAVAAQQLHAPTLYKLCLLHALHASPVLGVNKAFSNMNLTRV